MQQQISTFPASGTPLYAELCRRQDVITRSTGVNDEERRSLFSEGVGRDYVRDVPRPIERPRYTPDGTLIIAPSIKAFPPNSLFSPPPRPQPQLPWYWRLFRAL